MIYKKDQLFRTIISLFVIAGMFWSFLPANQVRAFVLNITADRPQATVLQPLSGVRQTTVSLQPSDSFNLTFNYDANNNLVSAINARGKVTNFTYDANHNLTSVVDGYDNHVTQFSYDSSGNLVARTDANGNTRQLTRDDFGNPVAIQDARGFTTTQEFDGASRLTSVTNPLGQSISLEYDDNDNLTAITTPTGAAKNEYDANGRLISTTDANEQTTQYTYDETDNLIEVVEATGQMARYEYDDTDNLVSSTDPNGHTTHYEYDPLGRLLKETDPLGQAVAYEYDPNGNVTQKTDAEGQTTQFSYDTFDQLSQVTLASGAIISYAYDVNGNMTSVNAPAGTTSFEYDLLDQLQATVDPKGKKIEYEYDPAGNLMAVTYPASSDFFSNLKATLWAREQVTYGYDPDNRLVSLSVQGSAEYAFDFLYDPAGRLTAVGPGLQSTPQDSGGVISRYEYDDASRLTSLEWQSPNGQTTFSKLAYTYDAAGNVLSVTDEQDTTNYVYDEVYRLVGVTYPDGSTENYVYDAAGNRLEKNHSVTGVISYVYNEANQLVRSSDGTEYTYDKNGNLKVKMMDGETTTYTWDEENRLTQIDYPDGSHSRYIYDGLGRRINKTDRQGQTVYYLYDGANLVQELDAEGQILASYVYGQAIDHPYSMTRNGQTYFYLYDRLGSVIGLSDGQGNLVANYRYDPWGNVLEEQGQIENPFRFTGREWDAESGLYFYRARYYDPVVGRFISQDSHPGSPIDLQSLNQYIYVGNNPVKLVDPLGLQSCTPPFCPWSFTPYPSELVSLFYWQLQNFIRLATAPNKANVFVPQFDPAFWEQRRNTAVIQAVRHRHNFMESSHYLRIAYVYDEVGDYAKFGRNALSFKKDAVFDAFWLFGGNVISPVLRGGGRLLSSPLFRQSELKEGFVKLYTEVIRSGSRYNLPQAAAWRDSFASEAAKLWLKGNRIFTGFNWAAMAVDVYDLFLVPVLQESTQRVGGISLNKSAQVFTNLTDISGATYDPTTQQLILIGQEQIGLPPMNMDDFVVAVRSVYANQDPGVSIDPGPTDEEMVVRYLGLTEGTEFGRVMFEADRLLKSLSMGQDNLTGEKITSEVSGYKSELDLIVENLDSEAQVRAWHRMWFLPKTMSLKETADGQAIVFDQASLELKTEYLPPYEDQSNPAAECFVAHTTQYYDDFARERPVLKELQQLAKIVSVAKWLKDNHIPVDMSWLDRYTVKAVATAKTTPAQAVWSEPIQQGAVLYKEGLAGGVDFAFRNRYQPDDGAATTLREAALQARPEGAVAWEFKVENKVYQAVALSLAQTPQPGAYHLNQAAFAPTMTGNGGLTLALTPVYDTFAADSVAGLGYGWTLAPYRLSFPQPDSVFEGGGEQKENLYHRIVFNDLGQGQAYGYTLAQNMSGNLVYWPDKPDLAPQLTRNQDGTYTATRIDQLQFNFDESGRLLSLVDRNQNQITLNRQEERLTEIINVGGQAITFNYDNDGRITEISDPIGRITQYKYDENGNLASIVDPRGNLTTYAYDDERHLIKVTDPLGQIIQQNEYDDMGRLSRQIDAKGRVFSLAYDSAARQVTATDPAGNQVIWNYDEQYRVVEQTDPLGHNLTYEYGSGWYPIHVTDRRGNSLYLSYDERGNVTKMSNAPLPTLQVVTSQITSTSQITPALTPTSPEAYAEQAAQLRAEGNYTETIKAYQTIVDNYPDTPAVDQAITSMAETYEEWAAQLRATGEFEEALKKYQLILDEYDYSLSGETAPLLIAETYEEWATQLRAEDNYEEAIEIYQILSSEHTAGCSGQEVTLSVAETYVEWGQYLHTQQEYIEAMDKFTQAQEVTDEPTIINEAKQGFQDAVWALSEDTGAQGKQIIGTTWSKVCQGKPAASPAIGLVKQDEPGRMWFGGTKRPLPADLQASSPGHFIYAVCLEEGVDEIQQCTYRPFGLVTRQQSWWRVSVRDTRTATPSQERTFYGPEPEHCPGILSRYGDTITGADPTVDEVVAWVSTLNLPSVTASVTAPGESEPKPVPLPPVTSTQDETTPPVTSPQPPAPPTPPPAPSPSSSVCPNPLAQITYPPMDATVSGIIDVLGTANIPNFKFYKMQYRSEQDREQNREWGQLKQSDQPVVGGTLMEWNTFTVPSGVWWLRLVVEDPTGNYPEPCEIRVTVTP